MSRKHTLLMGTAILTATGFLSRLIGFFFRMFLSHSFGEEQVGLYQLIFPIYALCFSLTAAGLETAISRCTARKVSLQKKSEAIQTLYIGLGISVAISFLTVLWIQKNATSLAIHVLGDIRCETLLFSISYAIPFAAIHSCICGYYLGLKQTKIPAMSQLIEQFVRVASVYLIYIYSLKLGKPTNILCAVIGVVIGECFSSFFCVHYFTKAEKNNKYHFAGKRIIPLSKELLSLSVPLTMSRILLNLLQSVEAISIPSRLQQYGYTTSQALINYGVLTGMALPCVLFPSALTNSISTMLLPTVAEIQAKGNQKTLKSVIQKVFYTCFSLGALCCLILVLFGSLLGKILFHSTLAGDYLKTLAWICPFLYLGTTLGSIQTGLGRANITFFINLISLCIRIFGVLFCIPQIGMNGYLWSLLCSQMVACTLHILFLWLYLNKKTKKPSK